MREGDNPLRDFLATQSVVVLDGALATELAARGCDLNDPLWSARVLIEAPELIQQVHADYFAAGADVATTASYQATFEGFARRGLTHEQAIELMQRSVELARSARDAFWAEPAHREGRLRPLVAASVGPYGAWLADGSEYRGHYGLDEAALMDFHRPRLAALLAAGPDLLACETLPCLAEARALARLLSEFPSAYAWISFSCRDDAHNCQGEALADCLAALEGFERVVAVGINCTAPTFVPALLRSAARITRKPLLVYPNSGEQYDPANKCWHGPRDAGEFAAAARDWHRAGARLIGGCCRTGPAEIAAVAAWARADTVAPG
ncbi:homocysteine S-methyltransferase [Paludibacterium purpuratum]|uniref:S-methylmethionine:homocysteine methyltransferase n=1 Tax=Paludibacterium purpuratum TaxID=1144873 RepID=A0A4R7BAK5_9NEIS|nr:homocysteine S-methyltransferase [Paludibacterium purpuratum]TDR81980.1 homocysteine S-methyltransferase [Paludibacterium purpuratum]